MAETFAHGTELQLSVSSVYTEIVGCDDIQYDAPEPDEYEIKDHSNSTGYKRYGFGLMGQGKITTRINYDPNQATHAALAAAHGSPTASSFKLVFPTTPSETRTFSAFVKAKWLAPEQGLLFMDLELVITGAVT